MKKIICLTRDKHLLEPLQKELGDDFLVLCADTGSEIIIFIPIPKYQ